MGADGIGQAKLKRTRRPLLANFLSTADDIPGAGRAPAVFPPRAAPAPLYYLPSILLPSQQSFLSKEKEEITLAAEQDWKDWKEEREKGVKEIGGLWERVAEYEESTRGVKEDEKEVRERVEGEEKKDEEKKDEDVQMDVDEGAKEPPKEEKEEEVKEPSAPPPAPAPAAVPTQPDEVDAVEY